MEKVIVVPHVSQGNQVPLISNAWLMYRHIQSSRKQNYNSSYKNNKTNI